MVFAPLAHAAAATDATWLKLSTPEFTVVTSLKEKEARAWAGEFSQFIAAMRSFFADGNRQLPPLTVVIFARDRDFRDYRPLGPDGKPQPMAGFFSRLESSAVAGLSGAISSKELRRTIFHEGTHWFMSGSGQTQPVWLEEGFAEVFSTFEIEKGKAKWGSPIEEHVYALQEIDRLPLQKLLTLGQENLSHKDTLQTGIIYAESWAFVHYLIFGEHKMSRRAVSEYVALLGKIHPDEAFQRAFGRTVKEMDREFRQYLDGGTYFVSRQPLAETKPPQLTVASVADVANAQGRLALAGGRNELAEKQARAAIMASPEAPEGYVLLGAVLNSKKDADGARAAFGEAVARKSADGEAYFELAAAEQRAAAEGGALIEGMSAEKARRIADLYTEAIRLEPQGLAAFQNLAGIVNLTGKTEESDQVSLELGRKRYPNDPMIQVGLAVLAKRAGEDEKARTLLDGVLGRAALPVEVRTFASALDGQWEQQELTERTRALAKAGQFAEAVALVNARLERGVAIGMRQHYVELRGQLLAGARGQDVKNALDERRWGDAKILLQSILESDAPAAMKQQARRTLEDLNRRNLGFPPPSSPGKN